ncbi:MAG: hypothetical protein U0103_13370 [Candidatus Obscuribacterales bacterium]
MKISISLSLTALLTVLAFASANADENAANAAPAVSSVGRGAAGATTEKVKGDSHGAGRTSIDEPETDDDVALNQPGIKMPPLC